MYRMASILVAVLALGQTPSYGIQIVQTTDGLTGDWDFNTDGTITIFEAHDDKTYVFWAHEDGQPTVLAEIREIVRAQSLTSGTVKLQISKNGDAGATDLGGIMLDTTNITTILEGIEITGNLCSRATSSVDHVTGPIEVGGSLLNAMTVLDDLEGEITIADFTTVGADIEIVGDMLETLSIGTYIPNRTASTYDSIPAVRLAR